MRESMTVSIQTFGRFKMSYGEQSVVQFKLKDTYSWQLLKYLVHRRGSVVTQEELLRELWKPETFGDDIFKTTRVRLRRLRDTLDELGLGDRRKGLVLYREEIYELNPLYDLEVDVDLFSQACHRARQPGLSEAEQTEYCFRALRLLNGLYMDGTEAQAWVGQGRALCRAQVITLAKTTLRLVDSSGNTELLILLADKLLQQVPDDSELHSELLRSMIRHRCTAEAVSHFATLSRVCELNGYTAPSTMLFAPENWCF